MDKCPMDRRYITHDEVAQYLGISRLSVEKLRKTGCIPVIKLLSGYRLDIRDIDSFMAGNKETQQADEQKGV